MASTGVPVHNYYVPYLLLDEQTVSATTSAPAEDPSAPPEDPSSHVSSSDQTNASSSNPGTHGTPHTSVQILATADNRKAVDQIQGTTEQPDETISDEYPLQKRLKLPRRLRFLNLRCKTRFEDAIKRAQKAKRDSRQSGRTRQEAFAETIAQSCELAGERAPIRSSIHEARAATIHRAYKKNLTKALLGRPQKRPSDADASTTSHCRALDVTLESSGDVEFRNPAEGHHRVEKVKLGTADLLVRRALLGNTPFGCLEHQELLDNAEEEHKLYEQSLE